MIKFNDKNVLELKSKLDKEFFLLMKIVIEETEEIIEEEYTNIEYN
ncbi:MAG: hypothetical protein SPH93_14530 [Clostridium sp.]|nr:hypothetical protein [Clostridium sp.]MDY6228850.1 hypothetical protein [Clostridium sp.]